MTRSPWKAAPALAVICLVVLTVASSSGSAQGKRKAVLLSINDVYRIEGLDDGRVGGMARVRALRAELERSTPDLLFLHAGDFLSPSFLGRTYGGAQMIDLMNVMDGNPRPGAFDERMFVTFGNHEFDGSHCGRDGPLEKLVTASEFSWITSNLDFTRCDKLKGLSGHARIAPHRIVESGGLKIGILAVTLAYPEYAAIVRDPVATACGKIEELRSKGADVVVALTHQGYRADLSLLGLGPDGRPLPEASRPCKQAPDVVIGGHDHNSMALPSASPRLFKADADALSAWVVEIERTGRGALRVKGRLVQLDGKRKPDPLAQRLASQWLKHHDERFCLAQCVGLTGDLARACRRAVDDGACLKETFAKSASVIETEEIHNRSFETGFGNWLADAVREAGEADVAFLNSGGIRINQTLPAGTMLTRRHLEQMFPFKDRMVTRDVSGATLWKAMEVSVTQRGEGPWAHFSGMAVELSPPGAASRIAKILVKRRTGEVVAIDPSSTAMFKVAGSAFVLANGDKHGFALCGSEPSTTKCIEALSADPRWPATGDAADIGGLVRAKLRALDPARGLELSLDRRLCERGHTNCLVSTWK